MSASRERRRLPPEELDKLDEAGLERYLANLEEADDPAPAELKPASPEEVDALLERIRSKPMLDLNAASADDVANAIVAGVLANLPKDSGPDDEAEDEELARKMGIDR